jgi:hypothetical protein
LVRWVVVVVAVVVEDAALFDDAVLYAVSDAGTTAARSPVFDTTVPRASTL